MTRTGELQVETSCSESDGQAAGFHPDHVEHFKFFVVSFCFSCLQQALQPAPGIAVLLQHRKEYSYIVTPGPESGHQRTQDHMTELCQAESTIDRTSTYLRKR